MGRSLLLFVFIIAAFFKLGASHHSHQQAQARKVETTNIFLVRHAEKVTANSVEQDPDLSSASDKGASNLQQYLDGTPVDDFFSRLIKEPKRY